MPKDKLVPSPHLQVIIPYAEYESLLNAVQQIPALEAKYARLEEQFVAYRGIVSEILEVVRETRAYVVD